MPCLSFAFSAASGPIIHVVIVPPMSASGGSAGSPSYAALLDTGATVTCISSDVVKHVGLLPVSTHPVSVAGVAGAAPGRLYLFGLGLQANQATQPTGSTSVPFNFFAVHGLEFKKTSGLPFDVVVGRDILCQGYFAMSGGHGQFCW
jgi:hypothetical protein